MAEINLKTYTTQVKELEVAVYTQRRLMISQEEIIKSQHPVAPQLEEISEPEKPKQNTPIKIFDASSVALTIINCCLLPIVVGSFYCVFIGAGLGFLLLGIGFGVPFCFILKKILKVIHDNREKNETAERQYQEANKNYPVLLEEYRMKLISASKNHEKAMEEYDNSVLKYNQRYNKIMTAHQSAVMTLEDALERLYAENVIFPKYRNLIDVTVINEYLLSGRCDKLEGIDGAYNLYEMELRQNIIINQLSIIIDDLEKIRRNQYSLYQELQKSNNTINEILSETRRMNETQQLTAYFAGITALAEVSPKYYRGIVM